MPGIAGIISQKPATECEVLVNRMLQSMRHERCYVCGTYTAADMDIYCGWTAHRDSFAARQVFLSERGEIAVVFSGECFLDPETAGLLRRRGYSVSPDDGSWLLQLYTEMGERFFEKLNGLFSGLLIDRRGDKAFLFNDRYGMERVYWHKNDEGFYFASEAKALLQVLPQLREFDWNGVAEFLTFGCTRCPQTLFKGIQWLPAASRWSFSQSGSTRTRYFSPETWESRSIASSQDFEVEFEETFKRVLPRYSQFTGGVGISLTAGLDGRMIMACLPEIAEKPICYTFEGQTGDTLDARLAARVAAACGFEHRNLRIGQDFFSDFASYADKTVYVSDGCLGVLGTHEIYMNAQARRLAPVRLTGVFGGEILRGVSFSKPLGLTPNLFSSDLRRFAPSPIEEGSSISPHPVTSAISREIPERRFGVIAIGRSQTIFRTPYLDNELVALAYQIPQNLRSSSKPAITLIERNNAKLSGIPTDMGWLGSTDPATRVARRIFSRITFKLDYFYNEGLPKGLSRFEPLLQTLTSTLALSGRHKFLHYRRWLQRELQGYVTERLTSASQAELWDGRFLKQMAAEHKTGQRDHTAEINAVLMLDAVDRTLLKNHAADRSAFDHNECKCEPLAIG